VDDSYKKESQRSYKKTQAQTDRAKYEFHDWGYHYFQVENVVGSLKLTLTLPTIQTRIMMET